MFGRVTDGASLAASQLLSVSFVNTRMMVALSRFFREPHSIPVLTPRHFRYKTEDSVMGIAGENDAVKGNTVPLTL
jgi:hypothetical protein